MTQQCPNCSTKVELVQSTPVVILLCKGCGTFFDASFKVVGDLKTGLDMDKVPSKPLQNRDDEVVIEELDEAPKEVEQPAKRTESMLSVLSGGIISSSEFGCPKCGSSMKSMASPVTGNTLYTCAKCGHTGTNYVKK
ncbi:MAG: hypothetical protein V1836_03060 [Candidatus Aenigmatarchaeota archaeon]